MTECELIQGLRNGDEAAFKYLVDTFKDRVFNTAIGIVQNAEDAEDVTQEVFIQVFRSIPNFKAESKLPTWIYRITTSRALALLRSRKSKKRSGFVQRLFGENNGLFLMIAEEEKAIRKDPVGAAGSLAKKVFGAIGQ